MRAFSQLVCALLVGFSAGALADKSVLTQLPTMHMAPGPGWILYPSPLTASGTNPAALGSKEKLAAVQAAVAPRSPASWQGSATYMSSGAGINAQYVGSNSNNALAVGAGANLGKVQIGLSARDLDMDAYNPDIDFGIMTEANKGISLGAVLQSLDKRYRRLGAALGYHQDKKVAIEGHVYLPPFSSGSNDDYVVAGGLRIFAGRFEFQALSTYYTGTSDWIHVLGVGAQLTSQLGILGQFTTDDTWAFGATIAL